MNSKQLALDEANEGMILSEDLRDAQDKVLLPRGATLTDAILQSLKRRGIEWLPVASQQDSPGLDQEAERERMRQRLAILFRKFSDVDASPANRLLHQRITHYRLGNTP